MIFNTRENTDLTGVLPASMGALSFFPEGQTRTENGVVHLNSDGSFTYEPDEDFNGEDRFFYAATDADQRLIDFANIVLVVEPVNDAPIVTDAFITTDEDVVQAGFLFATDSDSETLRFSLAPDENDHLGNLLVRSDGSFDYRPDPNVSGVDQFTFNVSDGENITQATIQIDIAPVNDAPIFRPETTRLTGVEDGPPLTTQLIADDPDGDTVTYRLDPDEPIFGATDVTLTPDGLLTYTARPNASGVIDTLLDTLIVFATDEQGATTRDFVYVDVEAVSDPPIVEDIEITVTRGQTFIGQVEAIPQEQERLSYWLSDAVSAEAGVVSIGLDTGSFVYTTFDETTVNDQFELIVSYRGGGASSVLLVDVTIEGRPTFGDDDFNRFLGDENANVFDGLGGDDRLFGGDGSDTLIGGAGRDEINGDNGNDELRGGAGGDLIRGGFGRDLIFGGTGVDRLLGAGGSDTINGNRGGDRIEGGGQGDAISGGLGRDVLFGGNGRDTIAGGGGRDQISGGGGADVLTGNAGADRFLFSSSDGRDRITDFQQGLDLIEIDALLRFSLLEIRQIGDDVRISFDNTKIFVLDDQISNFSTSDFIFQ